MFPLVSTNTMPAYEPVLTMPYRVALGRSPVAMGPNRRAVPLYVTLYTLTMTIFPLTSYVIPDWSVATFDSESWDTEYPSRIPYPKLTNILAGCQAMS